MEKHSKNQSVMNTRHRLKGPRIQCLKLLPPLSPPPTAHDSCSQRDNLVYKNLIPLIPCNMPPCPTGLLGLVPMILQVQIQAAHVMLIGPGLEFWILPALLQSVPCPFQALLSCPLKISPNPCASLPRPSQTYLFQGQILGYQTSVHSCADLIFS